MAKGGGGGGVDATPATDFSNFSQEWEELFANQIFSSSLILGTSFHKKIVQIGPTVLALKLDEGRVLGGGNHHPPPWTFLSIFLTMKMTFNLTKFWCGLRQYKGQFVKKNS